MKIVQKILNDYLGKIIDISAMVIMTVLVSVVFIGICFRYFLDLPLAWSNELSQFLLVWLTFFGAAAATRRAKHLSIDDIFNALGPKTQDIVKRMINALICLFLIFMAIRGLSMARTVWSSKSEALQVSNGLLYLPLSVGFFLMLPYNLYNVFAGKEWSDQE